MSGGALAGTFYTMGYASEVARSMDKHTEDLLILSAEEYLLLLEDKCRGNERLTATLRSMLAETSFAKYWKSTFYPNVNVAWVTPAGQGAIDAFAVAQTLKVLGMAGLGSYIKKTPKGTYIIIRGLASKRSGVLAGTRYLATNPLMLKYGLGLKGLKGMSTGGFVLGIVVSSGIEFTDFVFNDSKTMIDLFGGIGVEIVKGGIGTLAGYLAASAVVGSAAVTVAAVTPLIIMVVVGVVVSTAVNELDNQYDIKQKVIARLKLIPEQSAVGIYQIRDQTSSWAKALADAVSGRYRETQNRIGQEMRDWMCPVCRRF